MVKSVSPEPAERARLLPRAALTPAALPNTILPRASRAWLVIGVPALAELVIGGYRLGGPPLWRDEGYTVAVSSRPVGVIVAMLRHQEAVHGFYYLVMHVVVAVAGTSAVALRFPSLLAMAAAAGLTGGLGRRLAVVTRSPAPNVTGLLAGVLFALLPATTWYAQNARPYALATGCAVAASWLLIRASQDRRWRWYAAYGVAIVLLGLLNVLALLLVAAHGVSMLIAGRRSARPAPGQDGGRLAIWSAGLRWLAAVGLAGIALSPLLLVAVGQLHQQAWIPIPTASTVRALVEGFAGKAILVPVIAVAVIVCLATERSRTGSPGWSTPALALPWLVLPPAVLLVVSVLVHPLYDNRYVLYCMPATALLAAAGIVRLGSLLSSSGASRARRVVSAALPWAVVAGLAAVLAGPQLAVRMPAARPDDLGRVAAVVAAHSQAGDAVIYLPWTANVAGLASPDVFAKLRDIGQARSPASSGTLRGVPARSRVLLARIHGVKRVWVVGWAGALSRPRLRHRQARLLAGMSLVRRWRIRTILVSLYQARDG